MDTAHALFGKNDDLFGSWCIRGGVGDVPLSDSILKVPCYFWRRFRVEAVMVG